MISPILFFKEGTCALGSIIASEWSNQAYRLCRLTDETIESEAFLEINPLGAVPTLKIDDMTITESLAILQYIGMRDRSKYLVFEPTSHSYHHLNQVMAYLVTSFHKAFAPIFSPDQFIEDEKIQKKMKKTVIEGNLNDQYQFINDYLVPNGFIFGHKTIADAYLYGIARWGNDFFDIKKEFPNVAQFQELMEDDPAVQFGLQIEKGKAKTTGKMEEVISLESISSSLEPLYQGLKIHHHGKKEKSSGTERRHS